jgi:hypothetical protein
LTGSALALPTTQQVTALKVAAIALLDIALPPIFYFFHADHLSIFRKTKPAWRNVYCGNLYFSERNIRILSPHDSTRPLTVDGFRISRSATAYTPARAGRCSRHDRVA